MKKLIFAFALLIMPYVVSAQAVDRKVEEVSNLIVELYKQKRALERFLVNSPIKEKDEGPSLLLRRIIEE